jgi:hypothetical protein
MKKGIGAILRGIGSHLQKNDANSEIINRKRRAAASITLTPQVGHKAISFQLKLEIIGEISPVTVSQNAYNGQ